MTEKEEIAALRREAIMLGRGIEEVWWNIETLNDRLRSLEGQRNEALARLRELIPETPAEPALPTPESKKEAEAFEVGFAMLRGMLEDCPVKLKVWFLNGFQDAYGSRKLRDWSLEQLSAARHRMNEEMGVGPGKGYSGTFGNIAASFYAENRERVDHGVATWGPAAARKGE